MSRRIRNSILILGGLMAFLTAIPTNDTNIAKNKAEIDKIETTTLKDITPLFDGVASDKNEFSVLDGEIKDQNIVIRLKHPFYIRQMVVSISKANPCKSIIARYSKDTNFWLAFEDIEKKETADSIQYVINGHATLANYLALVFLSDEKKPIRIQEIEFYPEMDVRLKDRWVKDRWINTDREVFNDIDTKIDTVRFMKYSKVGAPTDQKFKTSPDPVLEGELFSVDKLEPGTPYEYVMDLTDFNGNMLQLAPRQFMTKPLSLAYMKKVEGTFKQHFNGSVINNGDTIITNGSTDIDKGLAISGDLAGADQYVIIDLEKPLTFSEVITMWRNLGFSKDYSIQVSNDKATWNTMAEHQNANNSTMARASGHPIRVFSSKFVPVTARYIKVLAKKGSDHYSKHGNGQLELFEVKVFQ